MAARQKSKGTEMNQLRPRRKPLSPAGLAPSLVILFILAGGALAALASPVSAAESTAALPKVKIAADLVYGLVDGVELRCDVYSPVDDDAAAIRPAVLLIHGGAWSAGSRRTMGGHAMRLARAGIVGIAIDYRLAPTWKFPAQLDDVRTAMIWAAEKSAELGIDPARMGLFGYSAGGHLACMIGTLVDEKLSIQLSTTAWDNADARLQQLPQPLAICAGGPPCDLTVLPSESNGLAYFLGGSPAEVPDVYVAASPLSHASSGDTPTLFIHGERDAIVPLHSSQSLYQSQRQAGVASEFLMIEKQGHVVTFLDPKTGKAMVEFFQRRLQVR